MNNSLVFGGSSGVGKVLEMQLSDAGILVYATYNNNALEATNHPCGWWKIK